MEKPYKLKTKIKHMIIRVLLLPMQIFPINPKKVVINNYSGKGYGDNGRAIAESLLRMDPTLDIVWCVTDAHRNSIPAPIRPVKYASLRYLWELATAAAWVDNCRKTAGMAKRKRQFYVQTWHGSMGLKRVEKDVCDHLDGAYVASAKNDSKMADVILSGCQFFTGLCRRAFWFDGEILECGSPRLDTLFHTDVEQQRITKDTLGIPGNKKVVLYAPTFRVDGQLDCYGVDFQAVLAALEKKTGDEWVFAVRLHPNVADKANFITYSNKIINATNYPDLYELIPIADLVISDYSSLMFEAGLIHKPVMIFANDIAQYVADRNFYFDITKLPFPLAESNEALLSQIADFDESAYQEALAGFASQVGYCENGTAADTVAERILKEINAR